MFGKAGSLTRRITEGAANLGEYGDRVVDYIPEPRITLLVA